MPLVSWTESGSCIWVPPFGRSMLGEHRVLQPRLGRADTIDRRLRGRENPPQADATGLRQPDGSTGLSSCYLGLLSVRDAERTSAPVSQGVLPGRTVKCQEKRGGP